MNVGLFLQIFINMNFDEVTNNLNNMNKEIKMESINKLQIQDFYNVWHNYTYFHYPPAPIKMIVSLFQSFLRQNLQILYQ